MVSLAKKRQEAYYMIPLQNILICFANRDLKNLVYIFLKYQGTPCAKKLRAEKIYTLFEEIGLDKIKLIKTYSANSISKFTNGQIREIIEEQINSPANTSQDISLEKIPEVLQSVSNHVTEISEIAGLRKNLPEINASTTPKSAEVNVPTAPIPSSNSSSETSPGKTEVSTSSTISSSKIGSSNRS